VAKRSGGNVKALVGLDPAETLVGPDPDDTKLSKFIGNQYLSPDLKTNASASFALVEENGLYGGESEAETANLTVVMTALDSVSGDFVGGNGNSSSDAVKCMEYSF